MQISIFRTLEFQFVFVHKLYESVVKSWRHGYRNIPQKAIRENPNLSI